MKASRSNVDSPVACPVYRHIDMASSRPAWHSHVRPSRAGLVRSMPAQGWVPRPSKVGGGARNLEAIVTVQFTMSVGAPRANASMLAAS